MISTRAILQGLVLVTALVATFKVSAQYAYLPIVPTVHPAFELKGSQVHSWAEYKSTDGTFPSKQRLALVGRGQNGYLLEVRIESPAFNEPVVVRFELPADSVKAAPRPWLDVMELLSIGNGARPEMTQEPRDADAAEFGQELQRNMRKQ